MKEKIKIGITSGHKAGIGTEIIKEITSDKAFCAMYDLEVISLDDDPAGVKALDKSVEMLRSREIDAVVTSPISKEAASAEGFGHIGHTEFFSEHFGAESRRSMMIMVAGSLRIAVLTKHVPLKDVPAMLSVQLIVDSLRSLKRSMEVDFGISGAKIAVLGLNPHSGEGGMLGVEERDIIAPAIEAANNEGINAFGAFPADGFFGSGAYNKFDAVLAMYHDQGLIPFKTLSYQGGVNFTAGLKAVRTSPAHGIGLDIAGKGIASSSSTREAIYLACDIVRSRRRFKVITADPLKIQSHSNDGGDGKRGGKFRDINVDELLAAQQKKESN